MRSAPRRSVAGCCIDARTVSLTRSSSTPICRRYAAASKAASRSASRPVISSVRVRARSTSVRSGSPAQQRLGFHQVPQHLVELAQHGEGVEHLLRRDRVLPPILPAECHLRDLLARAEAVEHDTPRKPARTELVVDAAPGVGQQFRQGCPAGLSMAKSAEAEKAGATQHNPMQRLQSARSDSRESAGCAVLAGRSEMVDLSSDARGGCAGDTSVVSMGDRRMLMVAKSFADRGDEQGGGRVRASDRMIARGMCNIRLLFTTVYLCSSIDRPSRSGQHTCRCASWWGPPWPRCCCSGSR